MSCTERRSIQRRARGPPYVMDKGFPRAGCDLIENATGEGGLQKGGGGTIQQY